MNSQDKIKIVSLQQRWWSELHKEDLRVSGDFSWEEITEFGEYIRKETLAEVEKDIDGIDFSKLKKIILIPEYCNGETHIEYADKYSIIRLNQIKEYLKQKLGLSDEVKN